MRILVVGGLPSSLINFRGHLLKAMVAARHQVSACAGGYDPVTEKQLQRMGVAYHPVHLERAGTSFVSDLFTLLVIIKLMRRLCPEIVFAYTIKPVIYGGLASRLCSVPSSYSLVTGLGYALVDDGRRRSARSILESLYRLSLNKNKRVFFQNRDDKAFFLEKRLVRKEQATIVNGSGVDVEHYAFSSLPGGPVFLMIARLLYLKGVREYAEAAAAVKRCCPTARFLLAGDLDPNPNSVRAAELDQWQKDGAIEYVGYLQDVRESLQNCRCYVLPSYYREGVPRTILEAMSTGRPIITTDAPGCRETVPLTREGMAQKQSGQNVMIGENGFLVKARDADALAKTIFLLLQDPALAQQMARRSREIAEEKYDVHKVNAVILNAMGLT